jgi:uncharacterized protein YjiS (DUF1127 family)
MTKAANRRFYFWSGGESAKRYGAAFITWLGHVRPTRYPAAFINWLGEVRAMRRGRRDLARMSDHMLSDIGMSRSQAQTEANRKFWDLK